MSFVEVTRRECFLWDSNQQTDLCSQEKILECPGQESRELEGGHSRILGCLEIYIFACLRPSPYSLEFQDTPFPKALWLRLLLIKNGSLGRESVSLDAWRLGKS